MTLLVVGVLGVYALFRPHDQADRHEAEASPAQPQSLADFSENGVTVDIALEKDAPEHAWLIGTFTPERAHFHLYSKDLPRAGIQGQGRPTLLEIVAPSEVKPIGPSQVDRPLEDHYVRALEQSLPVYPAGPVTLRLPIELPPGADPLPAELSVTYMSCSDDTCLMPVNDKRIAVVISNMTER